MKRILRTFIATLLITGLISGVTAAKERKNGPKSKNEVIKILTEIGGKHWHDKMKVRELGPSRVGDTYYHIFSGAVKGDGFRIIIFDNTPRYLGYYATDFEPSDYGDGEILLDSGETDDSGNTDWIVVRIGPEGPKNKVPIRGVSTPFVKAPVAETQDAGDPSAAKDKITIEYRDWVITRAGQTHSIKALYMDKEGFKVTLKSAETGRTAEFLLTELSKPDREYVQTVTQ